MIDLFVSAIIDHNAAHVRMFVVVVITVAVIEVFGCRRRRRCRCDVVFVVVIVVVVVVVVVVVAIVVLFISLNQFPANLFLQRESADRILSRTRADVGIKGSLGFVAS